MREKHKAPVYPSKAKRIFELLSNAKEEGVKEVELFDDLESRDYTHTIKYRLHKILGDTDAVTVSNGIWYLSEEYWNMTKSEFKDAMYRQELTHINYRFSLVILAIVGIFACLLVVFTFLAYNNGRLNNFDIPTVESHHGTECSHESHGEGECSLEH